MKRNKVLIAVTGGIGSGKSTVCDIIKVQGFTVYSCDKVYAELLDGANLTAKIVEEFGEKILTDGKIDRRKLSDCVFNDSVKLEKLNSITHTEIFNEIFSRAEKEEGIVFVEVPLLFEGNYQNLFDGVVVVLRKAEDRILSVVARDGLSYSDVEKRIKKQYNYDFCDYAKYYVIHNDGNIDDLEQSIRQILLKITNEFKS